jgi:hypothetical protein
MLDSLRERIADNIRDRVSQDVREQLESVIKDRIESAQRERLGAAVRTAVAEQIVLGGAFNTEQIAQTVREDRIVDPVCEVIVAGLRERLGEVVGDGLADSVRNAVSETTQSSGPSLGVH